MYNESFTPYHPCHDSEGDEENTTSTLHETAFEQLTVEMEQDLFLLGKMLMLNKMCGHYIELLVESEPDYGATYQTN